MAARQLVSNARPFDSAAGVVGPLSTIILDGPRLAAARAMDAWKDDHPYGYGDSKKRPTATGSK